MQTRIFKVRGVVGAHLCSQRQKEKHGADVITMLASLKDTAVLCSRYHTMK